MRRRWRMWRSRQRSAIRFAMVPAPPRLSNSGRLVHAHSVRMVELVERWL